MPPIQRQQTRGHECRCWRRMNAKLRLLYRINVLIFGSVVTFSTPTYAQLEPDKTVGNVGNWKISTALYGVGCVAWSEYRKGHEVSMSGEDIRHLKLLVTVELDQFETKLNWPEDDISAIEGALTDKPPCGQVLAFQTCSACFNCSSSSPARTALINASITAGSFSNDPTAMAALPFSNSMRFDPIFTVIT